MGRLCAHFLFAGLHDWLVLGRWIGSFGVANWMEGYLGVIAEFTSREDDIVRYGAFSWLNYLA